jgi:L-lactate dehydrogenase (cytochrome)/(S)-mandelate dehydrogenase
MEQVVERGGGNPWFQLYMVPDRSMSYRVVERARVAGFEALVVTVDSMISTNREFSIRNGFTMPFTFNFTNMIDVLMHPRWLLGVMVRYLLTTGMPRYENYPSELISSITSRKAGQLMTKNETLEWDDLRALRKLWPRTLIVKGILDPQDAILAADCGADAVIVSNHGGIVFDSAMAPIEVLPAVVDAVGSRIPVLVDSGFRRGSDVVKALALGAKAVMIGRATLYGTAAAGEVGAARAIALLRQEIDRSLAQLGCPDINALDRTYVAQH